MSVMRSMAWDERGGTFLPYGICVFQPVSTIATQWITERLIFTKEPGNEGIEVRLSMHTSQVARQTGAYPGFCNMKRLGIFLLLHQLPRCSVRAGSPLSHTRERAPGEKQSDPAGRSLASRGFAARFRARRYAARARASTWATHRRVTPSI